MATRRRPWAPGRGAGRRDQGLDLRLVEQPGQRPLLAGAVHGLGRIVRPAAFEIDEAMELAQRRQAARDGGRRHATPGQLAQIGAHRRGVGGLHR